MSGTFNLVILAYEYKYKQVHFLISQSETFLIRNVFSSLIVSFKDQLIFISLDNCSFNILALYFLVTVLCKHV